MKAPYNFYCIHSRFKGPGITFQEAIIVLTFNGICYYNGKRDPEIYPRGLRFDTSQMYTKEEVKKLIENAYLHFKN